MIEENNEQHLNLKSNSLNITVLTIFQFLKNYYKFLIFEKKTNLNDFIAGEN